MTADGPDKTAVTMVTDMKITGRPAQFGRGVISDVADKIIGQFASCVASKLQAGDAPAAAESAEAVVRRVGPGARGGIAAPRRRRGGCRVLDGTTGRAGHRHRTRRGRRGPPARRRRRR